MALVAPDGAFLEVNDALCVMLARSQSELRAASWQQLTHPEDVQIDAELVGQLLAGEADSYHLRKRYLKPDGTVVHGELAVVAVRDAAGDVDFFISQISDLSAVVELQDRYRLIAENVNDVVVVADNEGVIRWASDSVQAATGWEPEDLAGVQFRDLVHPEDLSVAVDAQRALKLGEARQIEVRLRMASGEYRWMNLRVRPVFDDAGNLVGRVAG